MLPGCFKAGPTAKSVGRGKQPVRETVPVAEVARFSMRLTLQWVVVGLP